MWKHDADMYFNYQILDDVISLRQYCTEVLGFPLIGPGEYIQVMGTECELTIYGENNEICEIFKNGIYLIEDEPCLRHALPDHEDDPFLIQLTQSNFVIVFRLQAAFYPSETNI